MFTTELSVKKLLTKNPTYQLMSPLIWKDKVGEIEVPAKFVYNGASSPYLLRWLVPAMGKLYDRSVGLHDWLYSTRLLPRKVSDRLFYKGMRSDGVSLVVAKGMYLAVRLFGRGRYKAATEAQRKALLSLLSKQQ